MENKAHFENSESTYKSTFVDFGKILYIYAWFFIITSIFNVSISYLLAPTSMIYIGYYLIKAVFTSILLVLLVSNAYKINIRFTFNRKINLFYTGLLLWLIIYLIHFIIAIFELFISFSAFGVSVLQIIILILPIISLIFQLIAWNSLGSFFQNPKNPIFPRIRRNGQTSTLLLVIGLALTIISSCISSYISLNALNLFNSGLLPLISLFGTFFFYPSIILITIGYFLLSINLKKEYIAIAAQPDINVQNYVNQSNVINNSDSSTDQRNFCEFCGSPIEPFMSFCPECGKALKS